MSSAEAGMAEEKLSVTIRRELINQRAACIRDPIERLRFLRQHGGQIRSERRSISSILARALIAVAVLAGLVLPTTAPTAMDPPELPIPRVQPRSVEDSVPPVWYVETRGGVEFYSNGLQVQSLTSAEVPARRAYPVFRIDGPGAAEPNLKWQNEAAGIVFHATESHQAPFESAETANLVRIGRGLVDYVRKRRSYHYVIDRFGRVWRTVPEGSIAFHAGFSVWGDRSALFINLNSSFLGVALESGAGAEPTGAQKHAAQVLTEWLRSRYGIPARNCVAHAQVSVNPDNMRLGYHTDWAAGFPFRQIGLPDNYAESSPAVYLCGFRWDELLVKAAGGTWPGLVAAETLLRSGASAAGFSEAGYRKQLTRRYRYFLKAAGQTGPAEDNRI